MNFKLGKTGKNISVIIHDAPVGRPERFARTTLIIDCQRQEFSPYAPGHVIISYHKNLTADENTCQISRYSMEWNSGDEPFSYAKKDLLGSVRKTFGSIPDGFAEIVDEFLSIIHEDRRKGELKERIRYILNISDQKEIEDMVRAEVAEQIMKS